MEFQINVVKIQHDHPDSDLILFALGCVASLLAKRLGRTSVTASANHAFMHIAYLEHEKIDMPECGGEVMVTKISAFCNSSTRCTVFYHINPVDAESRGVLSWDGRIPTSTQSVLEVVARNFLNQQVAVTR